MEQFHDQDQRRLIVSNALTKDNYVPVEYSNQSANIQEMYFRKIYLLYFMANRLV